MVRDVGLAEDLAQDALVAALERWPRDRRPRQPGRVADGHRQAPRDRPAAPPRDAASASTQEIGRVTSRTRDEPDLDAALDDDVGDDLLRLVFTACHPVLSTEARVGADAAPARRAHDRRRSRAPSSSRSRPSPAHRARQAHARRGARAVRGAARRRAGRARLGVGARGRLPDLQRGLLGDRRRRLDAAGAVRGRAPARAHPRRARAARARGARARGADGDPGVARRARASARPASRCCCSSRTAPAGTGC